MFITVIIMHKLFTRFDKITKEEERSKKHDESARIVEENVQLLLSTLQLKNKVNRKKNLIDSDIFHPLLYLCHDAYLKQITFSLL